MHANPKLPAVIDPLPIVKDPILEDKHGENATSVIAPFRKLTVVLADVNATLVLALSATMLLVVIVPV